jgi:recombination protein RecT
MNVDRMTRIAMTEIRKTPALGRCQPLSLFAAVISAAQMGLEIGMGRCFLVPYKDECQLIPGWKGMVELANRSGRSACWTGAVFTGDQFVYQMGDSPFVKHVPMGEDDPDKITHVYAVGRVKGSEWPVIEVWPIEKVRKHRDRYNRQGTKHYSYREWEMYARKIPLLQVLKYLPSSPELEAAMILANTENDQHLTLEGVLSPDGTMHVTDERPANVDEDGAIDSGPGVLTFDAVWEMIDKATTEDAVNLARDLIRNVADEAHRAELDVAARAKLKTLK